MNILVLTPYVAWPLDHGGRIRSYHLLRALAKDHEITNLAVARTPRERDDAEALEKIGITVRPGLIPPFDMSPPMRRLKKWLSIAAGRSSLPARWWSSSFAALVREAVSKIPFDLAVVDSPWVDGYRPLFDGLPFVASSHNVESDILLDVASRESGLRKSLGRRDARLLQRDEAAWFRAAAAVIAVSNDDAKKIGELAPEARVSVIPNGVDVERTRILPPAPEGGPILFVGSFDYDANVEAARFLVGEILPRLRERLGSASVILAGRKPTSEVAELGRTDGVEVVASPSDLEPLYARASAVVVPIRTGGGTRIKILEGLAWGRPVVTTTAGMRGLAVQHDVHVLVADEPAAFAAAIGRLRAEPGLAARLASAGRAFVEQNHSWSALTDRYSDLVAGLGRKHP